MRKYHFPSTSLSDTTRGGYLTRVEPSLIFSMMYILLTKSRKFVGPEVGTSTAPVAGGPRNLLKRMARPGRFEHPTYRFVVCRSIQLS